MLLAPKKLTVIIFFLLSSSVSFSQYSLEVAFPNVSFSFPTDMQNAGDGSNRLFIVEQGGLIKVIENDTTVSSSKTFLDISERVLINDRFGLLSVAFHPDYENNGYFFVNYNAANPQRTVISRFKVSDLNPDSADENSEFIIIEIEQPHRFHNGGTIAFGPTDGYLYIALGDGGPSTGCPDPFNHGQNRQTLLGSFLRINVDSASGVNNYSIPSTNPFYGNQMGYKEEIFAWGTRNPWKFCFHPSTNKIWAAENGENLYEEINIVESGKNYGWKIMEGFHCYTAPQGCSSLVCDTNGLTNPVFEYGGTSERRSVIGGYFYRGTSNPELTGKYIYCDYLTGGFWALEYDGINPVINTQLISSAPFFTSFGEDESGELYMINAINGKIFRFNPTSISIHNISSIAKDYNLYQNYPNPFNPSTTIEFDIKVSGFVELRISDVSGKIVSVPISNHLSVGKYNIFYDASYLPSGIYYYTLRSGDFSKTKKMVLLK